MTFLDKIKATLASFQQRPDPTTAADDDRREADKNMNTQQEARADEQARMQQPAPTIPDPSQGVEEQEVPLK